MVLYLHLLKVTINLSPNTVITPLEEMDGGERQEFNNTKGRCFCLRVHVYKTRQKKKQGYKSALVFFAFSSLLKVAKSLKNTK